MNFSANIRHMILSLAKISSNEKLTREKKLIRQVDLISRSNGDNRRSYGVHVRLVAEIPRPPSRFEQQAAYERRISIIKGNHYPRVDWHAEKPCGPICPLNSPEFLGISIVITKYFSHLHSLPFVFLSFHRYLSYFRLALSSVYPQTGHKMHKLFDNYDTWKLTTTRWSDQLPMA